MKITKSNIAKLITEKEGISSLVLQDMFDKANYSKQTTGEFRDSLRSSFSDLINYGSNNGSISRLIYYRDTHAFFDEHYDEIEELRNEHEACTGEAISIKGDLKDFFARFGYETIAYNLANELFPDTF